MKILYPRLLIVALLPLFNSCEKLLEDQKKQVLLSIIVHGSWYVESFQDASEDITPEFEGYFFQFKENGTVTGSLGPAHTDGSWEGDIAQQSIISHFPNAPAPLQKLNGTWKIRDSGMDYVKARQESGEKIQDLHLRKRE